jgi:hypothetical protein
MTAPLSRFQEVVEGIRQAYHGLRAEGWADLPLLENVEVKQKRWCVGRVEATLHKSIPSVSWVRVDGSIEAAEQVGEQAIQDDFAMSALCAASTTVVCIIVGENERQAENIWYAILLATRTALETAANPGDFSFLTQAEKEAGRVNAGAEAIEQLFTWPFIVPKEVSRRVVVAEITHSDELHSSDGATHTTEAHPEED